ncbi:hypothetical protein UFOVP1620_2 [uncultured Caudovirales phage]|uniref:Uncharacterized protein n=1 Tax=uncultured Caudovirales phage TaxID=2100421 RepID=A0A6J5SWU2_9CAUD|nr:hypothetical protein UFOVP1620_2 [uncultured Caudovirales phage]
MAMVKVCDSTDQFSVPTGTYPAKLLGYKEMQPSAKFPDSGTSYVWEFEIIEGLHARKTTSRWTPTKLTMSNNFGKLVREMLGRPLVNGEDVDPDNFIGKKFTITVGPSADGMKTKVIMVAPGAATPATSMAPPPPGAPAAKPAPAAPVAEDKARKVFVSRDGVEQGTFMDYDLAYAELTNPTWVNAVVYDTVKKVYVPAREYLLPF